MALPIKTLVKDTFADFVCYKDGNLWYRITGQADADGGGKEEFVFAFPVPVEETEIGIFPARIKAITLMRWVRQHLEAIEREGEDVVKLPQFE